MKIFFRHGSRIEETMTRSDLQSYYWPQGQADKTDSDLITKGEYFEAWRCHFMDQGLTMKIEYFVSESQIKNWPASPGPNPNIKKIEKTKYDEITLETARAEIEISYPKEMIETVRKHFYISQRFGPNADKIWAAQVYDHNGKGLYQLGFNRPVTKEDQKILEELREKKF